MIATAEHAGAAGLRLLAGDLGSFGANVRKPIHEMKENDFTELGKDGFAVVPCLLCREELSVLTRVVDRLPRYASERGGVRGLLARSRALRRFAMHGPPSDLAKRVLGEMASPVKATLFDKTEQSNWKVPLHQDVTIAVEQRIEVEGFGPWSLKHGVVHVQPPAEILGKMVAIRVHIDEAGSENGALRVVPGSHRHGRMSSSEALELRDSKGEVTCPVRAGGAMIMFPLLLHCSSKSENPGARRVVHIEYSAVDLPGGLVWAA